MNIYKTSFLSLIATIVKTLSLFIVNKFVAVVGGPVALTQLGNFQNFSAIIQMFAGTMYQTATTKFTSELKSDETRKIFIKNLITLGLIQSVFVVFLLTFYVDKINFKIFNSSSNDIVLVLFLLCLPFTVFCVLINSFFNGIQYIRLFISINIIAAITNLVLVLAFGFLWGELGIYCAFSVFYFFVFFFVLRKTILYCGCRKFLAPFYFDFALLKKILFFSLITISSIFISNVTLIFIRSIVSSPMLPVNYAGYWQGVWNLSQVAMSFITISLSTYLLPAISKSESYIQVKQELFVSARIIIPFALLLSLSIYFLREYLVVILFTKEFMPMTDMFFWQFSGNVVKAISWLFGFVFVSRGMVKITILTEVLVAIFFIFSCKYLVNSGMLDAPAFAYFLAALFHFVLMVSLFFLVIKNEFK